MVFKGDGVIKDFPGNYTQYREWQALLPKEAGELKVDKETKPTKTVREKVKMTFKEKREFVQLEKDITLLEDEKKRIEEIEGKLNSIISFEEELVVCKV